MDILDQSIPAREDRNRIHCFRMIGEIEVALVEEGNERIKLGVTKRRGRNVTAK